jgi:hypothetical protein
VAPGSLGGLQIWTLVPASLSECCEDHGLTRATPEGRMSRALGDWGSKGQGSVTFPWTNGTSDKKVAFQGGDSIRKQKWGRLQR